MARNITLTLGVGLGADLGPNFNLTANVGSVTPSTATKSELTAGKSVSVDDLATQVTVTSTGTCTNTITQTIPCGGTTTTTTTASPYNYYLANRYDCTNCSLSATNIVVKFDVPFNPNPLEWHRPVVANGFTYRAITPTTAAAAVTLDTVGYSTCIAACAITTTTTSTSTTTSTTTSTSTTSTTLPPNNSFSTNVSTATNPNAITTICADTVRPIALYSSTTNTLVDGERYYNSDGYTPYNGAGGYYGNAIMVGIIDSNGYFTQIASCLITPTTTSTTTSTTTLAPTTSTTSTTTLPFETFIVGISYDSPEDACDNYAVSGSEVYTALGESLEVGTLVYYDSGLQSPIASELGYVWISDGTTVWEFDASFSGEIVSEASCGSVSYDLYYADKYECLSPSGCSFVENNVVIAVLEGTTINYSKFYNQLASAGSFTYKITSFASTGPGLILDTTEYDTCVLACSVI